MPKTYTQEELIEVLDQCEAILKGEGIDDTYILGPLRSLIWVDKSPLTKQQIEYGKKIAKELSET